MRSKLNASSVFPWDLRCFIVSVRSSFSCVRIFSRRGRWEVRKGCVDGTLSMRYVSSRYCDKSRCILSVEYNSIPSFVTLSSGDNSNPFSNVCRQECIPNNRLAKS